MRTFAAITAGGVLGVVVLKLLATIFLPLVGVVLGLFVMGVKLALLATVVWAFYAFFLKRCRREDVA